MKVILILVKKISEKNRHLKGPNPTISNQFGLAMVTKTFVLELAKFCLTEVFS